MSGGHFTTSPYTLESLADEIDELVETNDIQELNEWGDKIGRGYPPKIIRSFKEASHYLRLARIYATRIDYLVSGDDGEESFSRRLYEELASYYEGLEEL